MKHFVKRSCRVLAASLALVQLSSATAGAAFSSGFSYSYPVGAGLTYTRTEGKNSAGPQRANILTYQPNTGVSPIMVYADEQLYGSRATIARAGQYLEQQGKRVIGGTNADFFVLSSGIPIGLVIDEGELISSDAWQYAVGFQADGTAVIGRPTMGMRIAGASGTVTISYYNKTRTTAGAYLLDRHYDTSTHFSAHGSYIVLERLDDAPVTVNGTVRLRVVDKGTGDRPLSIGEKQMVLTKSDGANVPSWVDFPIGEQVTLSVTANDPRWAQVAYAVGGKLLIDGGTITTTGIDSATSHRARSAIGCKADGTVVLYEIDGGQSAHSAGLTAAELGQELLSLGCVQALCLDGGGSSAMVLREPGTDTAALISRPSDGAQRACANYILLLNEVAADGVTVGAQLTPQHRYLLPGASTTFSVRGFDASYGAAADPTDLDFAVADARGTVDGQTFTAGQTLGTATVVGSNGTVTGEMAVCVTGDVQSIALQSGGKALTALSVEPAQRIDIDSIAYHLGQPMASADRLFDWSVAGDVGTVDANGVFTAGAHMASGSLTCAYGGVARTIAVNVGMGDPQDATTVFDGDSGLGGCTASDGVTLSRVTDHALVARGTGSLCAAYPGAALAQGAIELPATDVAPHAHLTLWARGTGTQAALTAVFADAEGDELTAPLSAATTTTWQQLTAAIPAEAVRLTALRFAPTGAGAAQAALYLDQLVVSADHPVTNTDVPVVRLDRTAITVEAGASASLTGTATMERGQYPVRADHITVKVDGKPVPRAATMNGATLTVTTGALSAGTHSVTIDVTDDAGGRARATATVTAGQASNVFADTAAHWSRGYAALLHANGIMKGVRDGDRLLFYPDRDLTRQEFAVTMARLLGLDTTHTGATGFADDAAIANWARGAVYAVAQAGIMQGAVRSDGTRTFSPTAALTRAEVMTVIGRCLPRGFAAAALDYTDAADVPAWAREQVKTCVAAGIISGYRDHSLRPLGKITRGEISKVLALM